MKASTWADLVGGEFKFYGDLYTCREYDPNKGLRMELTEKLSYTSHRRVGYEGWVSERAIGRTYHEVLEE